MKNKGPCILIFLLLGCAYIPDVPKVYPLGVSVSVVNKTTTLSSTDSLVFESQLSFLDRYGYYDIGYVRPEDFNFTSAGTYHFLSLSQGTRLTGEPATVMILEDESGSYDTLDSNNFRSKMINKLCQEIKPPGSFMIGGYSRMSHITNAVEFSSSTFTTDWQTQQDFIFGLANRTGGISSLYDALSAGLEKFDGLSSSNKHLIALVHAADSLSVATLSDVVTKASGNQVKIHILYFGDINEVGSLPKLSALTGGMFAVVPIYQEVMTVLAHLSRLLTGGKYVYTIKVSYKPLSGTIAPEILHDLTIRDYINNDYFNPAVIYTQAP